jgi:hypothetical protein
MRLQMSSYDRPPGSAPRANTPYGFGIDSSGNYGLAPPVTLVWPVRCDCEVTHTRKDFFTVEDQWFNAIAGAKLLGR